MRLSIIVPFLNSHEIVRRQILHLRRMDLPDDVEILFMDDGSDPPLQEPTEPLRNFRIIPTNDFRPWTSSLARNRGAKIAQGTHLFMTDGDYILPKEAILLAREFTGDRLGCKRQFGVLDPEGCFTQDPEVLIAYGLPRSRFNLKGVRFSPHPNNFVMRATLFQEMGGYREDLILGRDYPQREDTHFKRLLMEWANAGKLTLTDATRPTIYMFPNGQFCGDVDYNPFNLFHTLTRKTAGNHWYHNPRFLPDPTP